MPALNDSHRGPASIATIEMKNGAPNETRRDTVMR